MSKNSEEKTQKRKKLSKKNRDIDLLCPVCKEEKEKVANECKHECCEECWIKIADTSKKCPICREDMDANLIEKYVQGVYVLLDQNSVCNCNNHFKQYIGFINEKMNFVYNDKRPPSNYFYLDDVFRENSNVPLEHLFTTILKREQADILARTKLSTYTEELCFHTIQILLNNVYGFGTIINKILDPEEQFIISNIQESLESVDVSDYTFKKMKH
jgi:hypothetical protein